jgi:hypothetical protein
MAYLDKIFPHRRDWEHRVEIGALLEINIRDTCSGRDFGDSRFIEVTELLINEMKRRKDNRFFFGENGKQLFQTFNRAFRKNALSALFIDCLSINFPPTRCQPPIIAIKSKSSSFSQFVQCEMLTKDEDENAPDTASLCHRKPDNSQSPFGDSMLW